MDHAALNPSAPTPHAAEPPAAVVPAGFATRHIGPREHELARMLQVLGAPSVASFIEDAVPAVIRAATPLELPPAGDPRRAAGPRALHGRCREPLRRRC